MQLFEQAASLSGVQAVDEVARALCRVQRLHRLLLGVCAQKPGTAGDPECQQPPATATPGRRAGRGGRARPQAARRPAPQQRQQPGHGTGARPPRQSQGKTASGAAGQRLSSWALPGPTPGPPDARPKRPAPCTQRALAATASLPCPLRFPQAVSPGKLSVRLPGRKLGAGWR